MKYVDGYVLPVPKKNLRAYCRIAQRAGKVCRAIGAQLCRITLSRFSNSNGAKRGLPSYRGSTIVLCLEKKLPRLI